MQQIKLSGIFKIFKQGLEKWLSGVQLLLLLQRTQL